ncbi:hypothetical protein TIFTF001_025597 [Ficus carica]|uniref:Uncharacterized protein n=1 Tax=Ficus carica TaxID=3494 RepID=A0AA88AX09_FICCA|nr:hypothetical protein TIFTF001_025597 [Ficus carica]
MVLTTPLMDVELKTICIIALGDIFWLPLRPLLFTNTAKYQPWLGLRSISSSSSSSSSVHHSLPPLHLASSPSSFSLCCNFYLEMKLLMILLN